MFSEFQSFDSNHLGCYSANRLLLSLFVFLILLHLSSSGKIAKVFSKFSSMSFYRLSCSNLYSLRVTGVKCLSSIVCLKSTTSSLISVPATFALLHSWILYCGNWFIPASFNHSWIGLVLTSWTSFLQAFYITLPFLILGDNFPHTSETSCTAFALLGKGA